jgi:hypothetical protein
LTDLGAAEIGEEEDSRGQTTDKIRDDTNDLSIPLSLSFYHHLHDLINFINFTSCTGRQAVARAYCGLYTFYKQLPCHA